SSAAAILPVTARADTAAPYLPFVSNVRICPENACDSGRQICPTDSIAVLLSGELPDDCHSIRRIELRYPIGPTLRIAPPSVFVVVDDGACLGRLCIRQPIPWHASVALPPLPEGPYGLMVVVVVVSCSDSLPPPPWPSESFPFAIA